MEIAVEDTGGYRDSLELTANSSSFHSMQFHIDYLSKIQNYDFFTSYVILEAIMSSAAMLS